MRNDWESAPHTFTCAHTSPTRQHLPCTAHRASALTLTYTSPSTHAATFAASAVVPLTMLIASRVQRRLAAAHGGQAEPFPAACAALPSARVHMLGVAVSHKSANATEPAPLTVLPAPCLGVDAAFLSADERKQPPTAPFVACLGPETGSGAVPATGSDAVSEMGSYTSFFDSAGEVGRLLAGSRRAERHPAGQHPAGQHDGPLLKDVRWPSGTQLVLDVDASCLEGLMEQLQQVSFKV